MTITLIQSLIFLSYVGYLLIRFRKPLPSLSESWYRLGKNERHLFTLFCWSIGFLMMFQMDGSMPFFFFSGAGLCFVGAATMFKERMTGSVHNIGAYVAILCGFAGLYFERGIWLPFVVFAVLSGLITVFKVSNKTFWIEILAFMNIMWGLIISQ